MFKSRPADQLLEDIVRQGTVDTFTRMPMVSLIDLTYEYREQGNSFMLGLVAEAAAAHVAYLGCLNSAPMPQDDSRRHEFFARIARIQVSNGYAQIHAFANGKADYLPYVF